ncbi:alpha/beta hydrolase family protein [Tenggerimyces flavus]|uniref:Alpha/beta hydrolase family protein n=1 Tax=Tenggerimyces flavus TaxID=1708749 RepID=A0ABV7YIF5_9ACTN|nr:prolyl oligopeptidase family serine peptidase [Tenggerimyces flavus]MBM7787621.1 alpha-beta hydrolase superfamily lysophospholipase [Tenggerimyces flavus]
MLTRTSFRFSPTGRYAACLAADRPGAWQLETWLLDPPVPPRRVEQPRPNGPRAQVLPMDDGRILLCQPTDAEREHEILLAGADGRAHSLGTITADGLRLLEHPNPQILAVAVASFRNQTTTLSLVRAEDPYIRPSLTLEGLVGGGTWLDGTGRWLALNRAQNKKVSAIAVNLRTRSVTPLWPEDRGLRLLFATPDIRVVADAQHRVGWCRPGGEPSWPAGLEDARRLWPLAADPWSRRIAFRVDDGSTSRLAILIPGLDQLSYVRLPAGTLGATASWTEAGLRVPFAGQLHVPGIAEVRPGSAQPFRMLHGLRPAGGPGGGGPQLERFEGPSGPVDAVVYGDWRTAPKVLVALHGGPDAAWQLQPDQMLTELAGLGLAVVAVNPTGSRGSGSIAGAWGGPDLADVRAVASTLAARRGPLLLLGTSYGAYLALLTLGADPELWSRGAVLAPFLSGPRLYLDARPRVRALLDRLGGRSLYQDALGPRDALHFADQIRVPVLIVHGARDDVIPASHSRELYARLTPRHFGVRYLELADAGHDLLTGPSAGQVLEVLRAFLADSREPREMATTNLLTPPRVPAAAGAMREGR